MTEKMSIQSQIEHIQELLDCGKVQQALMYVDRMGQDNGPMKNARGVCLMRLGKAESAAGVLRDLVFGGLICIPSDTPPLYQANYAAALLMKGYNQEAMEILAGLGPQQHPYIAALYERIVEWKRGLNLFQRLACRMKLYPHKPIPLNGHLGSL